MARNETGDAAARRRARIQVTSGAVFVVGLALQAILHGGARWIGAGLMVAVVLINIAILLVQRRSGPAG